MPRSILKQNAKIHKEMHDDYKREEAEKEAKKSRMRTLWEKASKCVRLFLCRIMWSIIGRLS